MTNDKHIPYQPLNRLGFEYQPSKKLAYSHTITSADEKDLNDVWNLAKFYHFDLPFKDSLAHIIRNPRNVSTISIIHQSLVPASVTDQEYLEGKVIHEEVAGFVCIAPIDVPYSRSNVIRVNIRALYHNISLSEEQVAFLLYEALHQYCVAKISTDVPTKLEADVWLAPTEATFFRTVYGYLNVIFQDSYAPLRLPDVGYETTAIRRLKEEAAKKAVSRKWNTRKNLNDPKYWHMSGDHHTLIFPRLPGPSR